MGKTPLDDYRSYVEACSEKGFSVNYEKREKYYHADNSEGFHISLAYEGNQVMSIEIERPEEMPEKPQEAGIPAAEPGAEEEPSANAPETEPDTSAELVDGMRPEFKEAMDDYEAFYDEYCDFMKKYEANPSGLTLLTKYADMLGKLSDMDEKFNAWGEQDMNNAELKYYLAVQSRIAAKLLEIAGN